MNPTFGRLTLVELRKMVDTRAGFWLQLIVAGLTLGAVTLFCIFGETDELIFRDMFALAIFPASLLLPIVGILLVTSEWTQRTALITFTLVPKRMRVVSAKLAAGIVLGLLVTAIALVVAVIAIVIVSGDWEITAAVFGQIVLLAVTSLMTGIAFGSAFLNSAPAIVLYFALPAAFAALGAIPFLDDWADWLDTTRTTSPMSERAISAHEWLQFGTSQLLWLALPLAIGIYRITRNEIRAA
jgi:ABC-2 type transport system permease protein